MMGYTCNKINGGIERYRLRKILRCFPIQFYSLCYQTSETISEFIRLSSFILQQFRDDYLLNMHVFTISSRFNRHIVARQLLRIIHTYVQVYTPYSIINIIEDGVCIIFYICYGYYLMTSFIALKGFSRFQFTLVHVHE